MINKEGMPRFYLKVLISLEELLNATQANKEARKKMNSSNSKSFNIMKQKLRKHNKELERHIKAYKEVGITFQVFGLTEFRIHLDLKMKMKRMTMTMTMLLLIEVMTPNWAKIGQTSECV